MKTLNVDKTTELNKAKTKAITTQFDLIVIIVHRGFSDYVIDAAKEVGASGATILSGRGTSVNENDQILGIKIQPEKELVLILVNRKKRTKIMQHICDKANLNEKGKGICFSMPVSHIAGVNHLLTKK